MQPAQQIYESSVCALPSSEQLQLATLILAGMTRTHRNGTAKAARPSVRDILDELPGGQLFKTSAEVDAYLREERDSWDR